MKKTEETIEKSKIFICFTRRAQISKPISPTDTSKLLNTNNPNCYIYFQSNSPYPRIYRSIFASSGTRPSEIRGRQRGCLHRDSRGSRNNRSMARCGGSTTQYRPRTRIPSTLEHFPYYDSRDVGARRAVQSNGHIACTLIITIRLVTRKVHICLGSNNRLLPPNIYEQFIFISNLK